MVFEVVEAAETAVVGTVEAVEFEIYGAVAFLADVVEARVVVEIDRAVEAVETFQAIDAVETFETEDAVEASVEGVDAVAEAAECSVYVTQTYVYAVDAFLVDVVAVDASVEDVEMVEDAEAIEVPV